MKKIKLSDFKIIPVLDSLRREDMSDEEYFGKTFKNYVSNSALKNINPDEDGSPMKYLNPPHFTTSSLSIGTAVHLKTLNPWDGEIAPKMGKPTAKLGECVDWIIKYRKQGYSIYDSIMKASEKADYYSGALTRTRIRYIIKNGLEYYIKAKSLKGDELVLNDKDYDTAFACINSLANNKLIMSKLHPVDDFFDPIPSFMEDAMFIDFVVTYKNKYCTTLKYKMKIDNWTIDVDKKHLALNDLKTSRDNPEIFMDPKFGHFNSLHYYRQGSIYFDVLALYCMKYYGYNPETWTTEINFLVVRNNGDHASKCCRMSDGYYRKGKAEYIRLFKILAYYQIFGFDQEVEFIK